MRDFENIYNKEIADKISKESSACIDINITEFDLTALQYFLTKNLCYTTIIDDYPYEIVDKNSLLEALYYQAKLISVFNLNWDSIQEGLRDALVNFKEFNGICLLFRKGKDLKTKIPNEINLLVEIVDEVNSNSKKKINIIFNI